MQRNEAGDCLAVSRSIRAGCVAEVERSREGWVGGKAEEAMDSPDHVRP